jgi:type I restriction enzyme S subunit
MKDVDNLTPLRDVVELIMGQAPPSKDTNFERQGVPFVKVGEFGPLRPVIREWTTNPLRMARTSDVLLCVVGATCGKINLGENCAIGRSVAAIRPNSVKLDQFYLYYFMMTLVDRLRSSSVGAAQTVISKEMVESVNIPLPSLPEQQRIVALLDKVFAGLATAKANAERNLSNARALFESHCEDIFSKARKDWGVEPLGDLCVIARGGSPRPISEFLTSDANGVNWIKISDASASNKYIFTTEQKIKPEGAARSRMVHDGDFLLSNSMSFGRPYIMRTSGCIHDGWLVLSDYRDRLSQDYLYYLLGSNMIFRQFDGLAAGSTVRNLNIDLASRVEIPVPPLDIQQNIASKAELLAAETQHLTCLYERKLAALEELKKSLLSQALNGEL